MVLDASLLNTQHYKVHIKVNWNTPGKRVAPSPTPRYSSYWKGNLRVTLDHSRQLSFFYMYKMDWTLNNLQWLIWHKTKSNQTKPKFWAKSSSISSMAGRLEDNSQYIFLIDIPCGPTKKNDLPDLHVYIIIYFVRGYFLNSHFWMFFFSNQNKLIPVSIYSG